MRRMWMMLAALSLAALVLGGCKPDGEAVDDSKKAAPAASSEAVAAAEAGEAPADEAAAGEAAADEAAPVADTQAAAQPAGSDPEPDRLEPGQTRHFGGDFTLDSEPLALAAALAEVEALLGKPIKVSGQVQMACRKKGCWMTLEPGTEGAEPLRVTFKDYKFFVPRHADGASAVLEGEFVRETQSEAMRKHLAEDAGKSEAEIAEITGDVHIVQFVATAVDLTGGPAGSDKPQAAP